MQNAAVRRLPVTRERPWLIIAALLLRVSGHTSLDTDGTWCREDLHLVELVPKRRSKGGDLFFC